MRDSVEFEYRFQTASGEYRWMQDRGRAVEWDLRAGRCWSSASRSTSTPRNAPKRTCAPANTCSRPRPGAPASACGKPTSSPTPRAGSTTGATATTSIPATATSTSTRWDENLHPGRRPGGHAALLRTRQRQGRVLRRRVPHQDALGRVALGVRARPRGRARCAAARRCACSACAWTSTRPRSPSARANARNERVEAALQLTTAGVWDWDVEHGITHNTDGYYRVFGVDPAFGRANHMNWRQLLGTDPDQAIDDFRRTPAARRCRRAGAGDRISLPAHRWQLALGARPRLRRGARPGRRHAPRARPGGRHHRAQDPRDRAVGRRPALPRRGARTALRDLRDRRRNRAVDRTKASSVCSATHRGQLPTRRRLGGAGAPGRPAAAQAMVRPRRRVDGRAPVPHPPPRRPLHHAARFTLRGARRRRQGGAHRRRGHRHQRAGARPGGAARLAGTAADGGRGHRRLADPGRHRAARAVHQPRHPRAFARKHHRPARSTKSRSPKTAQASSRRSRRCSSTGESVDLQLASIGHAIRRPHASIRASARCVRRAASPAR